MGVLGSLDDAIATSDTGSIDLPELPEGWTRRCSAAYICLACAVQDPAVDSVEQTVKAVWNLSGARLEVARESVDRVVPYLETILNGPNAGGDLFSSVMHHATIAQRVSFAFTFHRLLPALEKLEREVGNVPTVNEIALNACRNLWVRAAHAVGMQIPEPAGYPMREETRYGRAAQEATEKAAAEDPLTARDAVIAALFFSGIGGALLAVTRAFPEFAVAHGFLFGFATVILAVIGGGSLCAVLPLWLAKRWEKYEPGGGAWFIGAMATIALTVGAVLLQRGVVHDHREACRQQFLIAKATADEACIRLCELPEPWSLPPPGEPTELARPYLFLTADLRPDDTPDLSHVRKARRWLHHGWGDWGRTIRSKLHETPPEFRPGTIIVAATTRRMLERRETVAMIVALDPETLECTWRSELLVLDRPTLRWSHVREQIPDLQPCPWYIWGKKRNVRWSPPE